MYPYSWIRQQRFFFLFPIPYPHHFFNIFSFIINRHIYYVTYCFLLLIYLFLNLQPSFCSFFTILINRFIVPKYLSLLFLFFFIVFLLLIFLYFSNFNKIIYFFHNLFTLFLFYYKKKTSNNFTSFFEPLLCIFC